MKSRTLTFITTMAIFAVLSASIRSVAQDDKGHDRGQSARLSQSQISQRISGRLISRKPVDSQAQVNHFLANASPEIIWVQCPAAAQALGATCGKLPVPLDYNRPDGAKLRIYFEIYLHTSAGPAESAILANIGGPGLTTTGLQSSWLFMFAANMDVHDLLLIDDRGRGMSEAIDCKPLQHGWGPTFDDEIADCAAQMGPAASFYSTGDIAIDADAVRAALGYDLVDYYGGSAGGVDVVSYATRFGSHLRSIILDSGFGPPALLGFNSNAGAHATVREVRLDCLRSPTCSIDHAHTNLEWEQLIETIREQPLVGTAYDASGNKVFVTLDETSLFYIAGNPTGNFVGTGELLAAADSLQSGDPVPLLRLGAEGIVPLITDSGDPTFFSYGGAAAACVTLTAPYQWSVPPEERLKQFAYALAELPTDYFAPFSKTAGAAEMNLASRECLFWEEPTTPLPVVPVGANYPNIPTLAFASDIDTNMPTEMAKQVANLFPKNTFLVVPEGDHEPTQSNQCALGIANHFLETLQVGDTTCLSVPETIWPATGRFPAVAPDARPAEIDPGGDNQIEEAERKVVTVAVATAIDALKRSTIGSGNGVGLRAGTFQTSWDTNGNQTTTLTNCAFANDVTVNGTLTWGTDFSFVADLTVGGTGTAGGTLHVEGTWEAPGPVGKFNISGTLGGKNVRVLVPEA